MKTTIYNTILIVLLFQFVVNAQTKINPKAPINPVALQYTVFDFGLRDNVKQVDKMHFDNQGRITQNDDDGLQFYTYSPMSIEVKKYGYTYIYKLNAEKQIISWIINGEKDYGSFKYDSNGNLTEKTSLSDDFISKTTYEYDTQNRLISSSEWTENTPFTTKYSYEEASDKLLITSVVGDDLTSKTVYYYKNGILENYFQLGAFLRERITYDTHGNWIRFYNPIYGQDEKRVISYY